MTFGETLLKQSQIAFENNLITVKIYLCEFQIYCFNLFEDEHFSMSQYDLKYWKTCHTNSVNMNSEPNGIEWKSRQFKYFEINIFILSAIGGVFTVGVYGVTWPSSLALRKKISKNIKYIRD